VASRTTLDRFGRVVIPKQSRDHFGLAPGSTLTVIDGEDGILLRPGTPEAALKVKRGVLVFSGEVTADVSAALPRERDARIRRFLPRRKP